MPIKLSVLNNEVKEAVAIPKFSEKPLVSIIIPAYNMAEFAVKAVESALNQTYRNIEIIVVDDGSVDNTRALLACFGDRIKYIYKGNGGVCSARNLGIKHAKGEMVALIDNDDVCCPEKIELCVKFLQDHPDYGLVHTDAYYIDGNDKIVGHETHPIKRQSGWIKEKLIVRNFICNPTVVLRKECFKQAGMYDESLFPLADWDLWLRISEYYKIGHINQPLSKYRITSSASLNNLERTRKETLIVFERFFLRNPDIRQTIKKMAYSTFHKDMAMCYLVKNNDKNFKEELFLSLRYNPFNIKAIGIFFYYLLAPQKLKEILKKKILIVIEKS